MCNDCTLCNLGKKLLKSGERPGLNHHVWCTLIDIWQCGTPLIAHGYCSSVWCAYFGHGTCSALQCHAHASVCHHEKAKVCSAFTCQTFRTNHMH